MCNVQLFSFIQEYIIHTFTYIFIALANNQIQIVQPDKLLTIEDGIV